MNIPIELITAYIQMNLVLCAGTLTSVFLLYAIRYSFITPMSAIKVVRALIVFMVLLPGVNASLPTNNIFKPATQIWSAPSMRAFAFPSASADVGSYFSIGMINDAHVVSCHSFAGIVVLCAALGLFIFSAKCLVNAVHIRRTLQKATLFRVVGRVRLYASEQALAPFSIWRPGRFAVVVPTSIIEDAEAFSISVYHELQHHRQGDTMWVYALQLLKALFFWNPFVYCLERTVSEIQELSCDGFLIARRKISPHAYSRCLIRVAELACNKRMPLFTIGMPTSISGKKLKRRMEIMFSSRLKSKGCQSALLCVSLCFCCMVAVSFASQGLVRDRRISLEDARKMAENVERDFSFPVKVNEIVLKQLNCYLGTPDGRSYMRGALDRMAAHRTMIEQKLSEYGAPKALMAVPLVESGYKNISQGEQKGAGLWQFIPSTAKHFGLRVDDKIDERLDAGIETDAAIRYLMANNLRFRDWGLSLLAYNAGGKTVQNGIDATGSRDPWTLIQAGYENDKGYLGKIVAAVIIMCNPSLLDVN